MKRISSPWALKLSNDVYLNSCDGFFFLPSNAVIPLKISFKYYFLRILYIFKFQLIDAFSCPRLHNCCGESEGWDPVNRFNQTSWAAVIAPTDRPKSVHNRCVIEVFGGVFVLSCCFLDFLWVYGLLS